MAEDFPTLPGGDEAMVHARQVHQQNAPMIFLFGPPGAGKSTLGTRACEALGLSFLDLADAASAVMTPRPVDIGATHDERLRSVIDARAADVVEIPWSVQRERKVLALTRKSGVSLLLWAHPEDMLTRSGHRPEAQLTPVPRLKSRSGFGRTGSACREFRQLDRACTQTLMLVDVGFDDAARAMTACISELRPESCESPAEREGIRRWVEHWRHDHGTSPGVAEIIVDAMARYLAQLRARGCSPRTLAGIRSDLNAAGHLVIMYDDPTPSRVLEYFDQVPWAFEFSDKFTDSPALVSRYHRSLEGFARFLRDDSLVASEE